ncbi:chromate efflux transporter [Lichenicola sp.]|uniref:chromate efflux transporter n=1 Tax=Lichenicola sp. TaxID=2804529 RepID=UPI003AFFCFD8
MHEFRQDPPTRVDTPVSPVSPGTAVEVFAAFLRLGLTSFGGPVAHLGYFRAEFVLRRRWLDERAYADLVGLCQFLPGPASSQAGFAIGLMRAGLSGGLAAWAGFTLPSALLLLALATGAGGHSAAPVGAGLLHGLGLVAVAVVAQAVWGMARSLCPDRTRASLATLAAILVLFAPTAIGQVAAICLGALAGWWFCRERLEASDGQPPPLPSVVRPRTGIACLALFAALLSMPLLIPTPGAAIALFDAFYRSGALVFGGGHVVLPLLHDAVVTPGWVSEPVFLSGYGLTQAMPGPLFTFAAYLGGSMPGRLGGAAGAGIALVAIFLPGLLLLAGVLPFWHRLQAIAGARAAMRGANAAVVGLLGAALYNPLWTSTVRHPADLVVALLAFTLLVAWRIPPLLVVVLCAGLGALGG